VVRSLRRLAAAQVETFFLAYGQGRGPGAKRTMQRALRHFLRFCADQGWVSAEFVDAVPTLKVYRLSAVPRGLSATQIETALAWVPHMDTTASLRDQAILLLLATYGVRCGQVVALRLRDLDWEGRRIRFRPHKGGKPVLHSLTASVATALARYLDARPRVPVNEVFLRARPPYLPLDSGAAGAAIRVRLSQAGLVDGPRGTHAFRHAFATRVLRSGQPLKVVADLLGHRDLGSAAVYAKVDIEDLRKVAAEWPEVLR
jgi:integrase